MNNRNSGFSLIELLITIAVLTVVSGAAVNMVYQSQFVYSEQTQISDASNSIRSSLDQVVRTLRQAGSDPLGVLTVPAVAVLGDGHVQVSSDVTGSVPSVTGESMESTGDPDGLLSSIGEVVTFRFDPDSEQLFMDIGYGESVLAQNITEFSLSFFDVAGVATTVDQDIALIRINITGMSDKTDLQTGRRSAVSLSSEVFLRSKTVSVL